MIEPIDVLAIAAHPDDVELSCAGTMLMAKSAGKRTGILDLTRGELSTRGNQESRAKETEEASKILKLDYRENLDLGDGNIELSRANLLKVIQVIRKVKPSVLLTPHTFERHPDHEAASELAHRATFYSGLVNITTQDEEGNPQEPHRPLLKLHFMQTYTFDPKIIIDVTPVFEDRMAAMQAYGSQFARPKNVSSRVGTSHVTNDDLKVVQERETFLTQSGFYEWIEARARTYGMIIGVEYGEPFWSHEPLGTKDLFSLVTKKVA